jgi:DNA (cytosine-5)-methyltransferase 1
MTSRFGTGGGNIPLVNLEPITFQPGNLRRDAGADPSTEATTTLKATPGDQMPHIAYAQGVDLYNQQLTGDLHCPLRTAGGHGAPATLQSMAVRRLTPVECERLQGFPDNYSQIPWKGKPARECPDGPRYKACGNSMAVPVMRFIGERIQKQIDGTL